MPGFLKSKLKSISIFDLLHGQIEALIVGLVSGLPTVFGMVTRNVVYRMLGMKI